MALPQLSLRLQGRNVVELSDVFSQVKLPVTLDDTAVQSDVEGWLYLKYIDLLVLMPTSNCS